MNQHQYWVFVKGEEDKPRNITPLPCGAARWYADTLAIELGVAVRVFRHGQTRTPGRLVSTHLPPRRSEAPEMYEALTDIEEAIL